MRNCIKRRLVRLRTTILDKQELKVKVQKIAPWLKVLAALPEDQDYPADPHSCSQLGVTTVPDDLVPFLTFTDISCPCWTYKDAGKHMCK